MTTESGSDSPSDRIQVNVTLKQRTLDALAKQHPSALDDSERVRRAIDESIGLNTAAQFSITRT